MPTLLQRLRAIEAALEGPDRYLDLRLDLTRKSDGSPILEAGGRWDKTFRRFLDPVVEGDSVTRAVIALEESQVEFASWFAEWLGDFREGRRGTPAREVQLAMMAGDRRGGKTFVADAAIISACIDVPTPVAQGDDGSTPLIAWIVSKSYRERFELEQWILNRVPKAWYKHRQAPEHEFQFVHGPVLRLLSADDPDGLKQGRVDICFVNEPQKIHERAVANIILGASDLGGLVILAANPPGGSSGRGAWMFDVKEAIDDEAVARKKGAKIDPIGIRYFHVDSKKNKAIDQIARRRAGRIATLIDPSLKVGDVEGEWKRPVENCAWNFDKHKHIAKAPDLGVPDITGEVAGNQKYGNWVAVGGIDFQNKPHIITAIARVFGDPDDPTFHFVGELVGERRQSEEQFLELFEEYAAPRGWTRENFLWIGDASSQTQGPKHDFAGGERDSFSVFHDAHWDMIPSAEPAKSSRTGRGKNPNISERLQLTNELLRRDRVFFDPDLCPWIIECFRNARTKREDGKQKIVSDKYAHGFDAATYLLWRLKPKSSSPIGSIRTFKIKRPGSDFYGGG